MANLIIEEIRHISSFLRRNYRETIVIGLAALFITLYEYQKIDPIWFRALIFLAILPIVSIIALLRENPLDFGFRLGNYRIWLFHVGVFVLVGFPILYALSNVASLKDFYTREQINFLKYSLDSAAFFFAWEFFFRGFLLFGLRAKLKEMSILVQMVPFVLIHFGKPELETISTIPMGIYFGYVAYRGNSYWPAYIIHMFINISFRIFVNLD